MYEYETSVLDSAYEDGREDGQRTGYREGRRSAKEDIKKWIDARDEFGPLRDAHDRFAARSILSYLDKTDDENRDI